MRLNPTVVLSQCPSALTYSQDRIRSTLEFLNSVGLDGARLISASPNRDLPNKTQPHPQGKLRLHPLSESLLPSSS